MKYRCTVMLAFCCLTVINAESEEKIIISDDVNEKSKDAEQLFVRLFKHRRVEQVEGVKRLLALERHDNQYKMVKLVAEKVFGMMQRNRALLEGSGYIPGSSPFPQDETVRDALASVLENTALLGDIVLRLPDIAAQVLRLKHEWEVLYHWSLSFCSQTSLLDEATRTLVRLVEQELNVTERDPNYVNPYRKQTKKVADSEEKSRKHEKKNKNRKKGPRITLGEL